MIEVGLVDVKVHHAWIRTTDLCDVGITETTTHLSSTTPILNLSLSTWVATFNHTSNDCRTLACTIQVGHHLTNGTAGIELAQPCGDVGLGIVGSQLLLQVHDDNGNVEVANGRQHIIRGAIGQHLEDDQVYISSAELVACSHRLLLGGYHATIDNLNGRGQRLLECLILCLKLRNELGELWQVSLQRYAEHAHLCFGFY